MKKVISALIVLLFLILTPSCEFIQSGEKGIQEEIAAINSECPKMIDSETRLERVELLQTQRIAYYFSLVNVYRQNVDTQLFRRNLWPGLLSAVRTSPELENLRENEMKFEYVYLDKAKQLIYTFSIKPEHYNR